MRLSTRFREDPITVLSWVELAAVILSFLLDGANAAFVQPYDTLLHPLTVSIAAGAAMCCAIAVFSIPRRANQGRAAVVIAIVTLIALGGLPPYYGGVSVLVLAGVLARRLSFSQGVAGGFIAWVAATIALAARVLGQSPAWNGSVIALTEFYTFGTWIILLGLIFGIIAVTAVYATRAGEAAAAKERSRIALDLHDALGHGLTTLAVQLQSAERLRDADDTKARHYLHLASKTVASLLTDVRDTVGVLRSKPDVTEHFRSLMEQLLEDFAASHTIEIRQTVDVRAEPAPVVSIALYRLTQEALTNVARHSNAKCVNVCVNSTARRAEVTIQDDGRGFSTPSEGNGLASMRERMNAVGGELRVTSIAGEGTSVCASAPIEIP